MVKDNQTKKTEEKDNKTPKTRIAITPQEVINVIDKHIDYYEEILTEYFTDMSELERSHLREKIHLLDSYKQMMLRLC